MGAGFSGRFIAHAFARDGARVIGTTRDPDRFSELQALEIEPVFFDGSTLNDALRTQLSMCSHLIISIAPPRQEKDDHDVVDPVLRSFAGARLKEMAPNLRWVCYLSTVGVYGNHDGAWIDEATPAKPVSERSRQRVRTENEWRKVAAVAGVPLSIFRLSGIYGPGRNALMSAQKGKARRLVKHGQVFNRIHVSDIATATLSAAQRHASGTFNVTDNEPAPPQDVVAFAHELMGKEPPPEIDFDTAELSPMARSFYGENKRVSNAKSKTELAMTYAFPNYREALSQMWKDGSWRG
ncbi:MAG: SDR family oxidoreductase [Ahrensia sp.]|nr:SDR family oxidoreductase [Ahrensia sp.]